MARFGQAVDYIFRIRNDCPVEDTILLEISGIPNDWDAEIMYSEPDSYNGEDESLDGGEEREMICRVRPASAQGASNSANLEILGTSENDNSNQEMIHLFIVRHHGVVLTNHQAPLLQELVPGEYFKLDIIVQNLDQEGRNFNLSHDLDLVQYELWRVIQIDESIFVEAGSETIVPFLIKPPSNTIHTNEGYDLEIYIEDKDDPSIQYKLEVNVNVMKIYSFDMEFFPDQSSPVMSEPDEHHEFLLRIRNTGTTEVTIRVGALGLPREWSVDFNTNAARFLPGRTKEFIFIVYVPETADHKGSGIITIKAELIIDPGIAQESTIRISVRDSPDPPPPSPSLEYVFISLMITGSVSIVLIRYFEYRSR